MDTQKKYNLRLTERAEHDIDETFGYIVNDLHNPSAFEALYEKLLNALDNVRMFPESCPVSSLILPYHVRKILVDNYIAFYEIDKENEEIIVTRFCYARKDLSKIF